MIDPQQNHRTSSEMFIAIILSNNNDYFCPTPTMPSIERSSHAQWHRTNVSGSAQVLRCSAKLIATKCLFSRLLFHPSYGCRIGKSPSAICITVNKISRGHRLRRRLASQLRQLVYRLCQAVDRGERRCRHGYLVQEVFLSIVHRR